MLPEHVYMRSQSLGICLFDEPDDVVHTPGGGVLTEGSLWRILGVWKGGVAADCQTKLCWFEGTFKTKTCHLNQTKIHYILSILCSVILIMRMEIILYITHQISRMYEVKLDINIMWAFFTLPAK